MAAGVVLLAAIAAGVYGYVRSRQDSTGNSPPPAPPADRQGELKVPAGPDFFRNVTPGSGIDFAYRNDEEAGRFTILESLGGGVALLDFDGDGRLDVFVTGGGYFGGADKNQLKGHPCRLYRNVGGWKFEDATAATGLDRVEWWYTHGSAVADYDRDGWPDLLVTGFGRVALFRNEAAAGGRRFTDVTAQVGIKDDSWATSAGWGDLDGDGFADLYICHYCDWSLANNPACHSAITKDKRDICPPQRFQPLKHLVLKNEGGKAFRDVTDQLGATGLARGLGVVLADLNDDARPDVYVASDMSLNFLYLNRPGKLEERGTWAGVAGNESGVPDGSMGVDVGDYDGTGRPSIWVTNFQGEQHALYRNAGNEVFQHHSRAAGVAAIGQHYVGFGTGFIDVDNDGWEDLAIVNGHVMRTSVLGSPYLQRPVLFRNSLRQSKRYFEVATHRGGAYFQAPALGRGLAVGDLDNDGWPDLVISHTNSPVVVLRNVVAEAAPASWIGIKLFGKDRRDAVGSTVTLETASRKLTRFAKGGGSYLSANDPRMLFGLGPDGTARSVTVKWAWGQTETWTGLEPGAYWELHEGDAKPHRIGDRK